MRYEVRDEWWFAKDSDELDLTVAVPAYAPLELISLFLEALAQCRIAGRRIELILVDDYSPEGLHRGVESKKSDLAQVFCHVVSVRNRVNLGRGATRNVALSLARGRFVLFLDCDGLLSEDYFVELLQYMERYPSVSVRGNRRVAGHLTAKSNYLSYFDSRFLGARFNSESDAREIKNLPPKFFATGEITVARSILNKVGGFSEEFSAYGCEDEELGWKLFKSGVPLHFVRELHVVDIDGAASIERAVKRMEVYAERSMPSLLKLHPEAKSISPMARFEKMWPTWKFRLLFNPLLFYPILVANVLLVQIMTTFDGVVWPRSVSAVVYKFLLGSAYIKGLRARSRAGSLSKH